jgi:hypothetical protein
MSDTTIATHARDSQQACCLLPSASVVKRGIVDLSAALFLKTNRFCVAVDFNGLRKASSAPIKAWSKSFVGRHPRHHRLWT